MFLKTEWAKIGLNIKKRRDRYSEKILLKNLNR